MEVLDYTEKASKNNKFGLKCLRLEPKSTTVYPNLQNPDRCVIKMYKTYIEHRPVTEDNTPFYLTPLSEPKGNIWFKNSPLGVHSIEKVTRELMKFKNDSGSFYTKTSLRRDVKQRLVDADVPKEVA